MDKKVKERKEAIRLRKRGMTYNEIVEELGVSKSTLSLWLRDLKLVPRARKRLARKISNSHIASGNASRRRWKKHRKKLYLKAEQEVGSIKFTWSTLAYVGAALYWAEGAKNLSMQFSNADPAMLQLYLEWLYCVIGVPRSRVVCLVNVHLNNGLSLEEVEDYWSEELDLPISQFTKSVVDNLPKSSQQKVRNVLVYGTVKLSVHKPIKYAAKLAVLMKRMGKPVQFVELAAEFR